MRKLIGHLPHPSLLGEPVPVYRDDDGRVTPRPADPWDSCLDVDPFTGLPDHQHGDACPGAANRDR